VALHPQGISDSWGVEIDLLTSRWWLQASQDSLSCQVFESLGTWLESRYWNGVFAEPIGFRHHFGSVRGDRECSGRGFRGYVCNYFLFPSRLNLFVSKLSDDNDAGSSA
jgi:hypothetical protein